MTRTLAALAVLAALTAVARADETSATDKLRILYSTRFTFTDDGLPLVTVEIMGGQQGGQAARARRHRRAARRQRRQHGRGRRRRRRGRSRVEDGKPAVIQDWTVVETLGPDDAAGIAAALARWKERGFEPRSFEIGTVFGTGGEVIDTREVRIAIDPVRGRQGRRARGRARAALRGEDVGARGAGAPAERDDRRAAAARP